MRQLKKLPDEFDLSDYFANTVKWYPCHLAVIFGDVSVTYSQLNNIVDRIAKNLVECGVVTSSHVGIYCEPSVERIALTIALVKLGATYVPLDSIQTIERRQFICKDSQVCFVVVDGDVEDESILVKTIHIFNILLPCKSSLPVKLSSYIDHRCYVMYTSGSTGQPKGVCISQRNVIALAMNRFCVEVKTTHRFAHASNFSFDPSTYEMWLPLLNGAAIVILKKSTILSQSLLQQSIRSYNIDVLWLTSSVFNYLYASGFSEFKALDYLILGGESLSVRNVIALAKSTLRPHHIINAFGPTETTTFSLYYDIQATDCYDSVPIGKPLDYESILLLDENKKPISEGEIGELYIIGEGVGQCYLNDPEKTDYAFCLMNVDGKEVRAYRTGDFARMDNQGLYHFHGRKDHQIKVNGYRVERSEILYAIEQEKSVDKVLIKDFPTEEKQHRLVAYVTLKDEVTQKVYDWQSIYDETYAQLTCDQIVNDFTGWSSYIQHQDFLGSEMESWLEEALLNIREMKAKRILEIGCGTGLLLLNLYRECEQYTGVDFSMSSINYLQVLLGKRKDSDGIVSLIQAEANKIANLLSHDASYDLIILNSVVQYFPDTDYFISVIKQLQPFLEKNGAIYLGDIRRNDLRPLLYAQASKDESELEYRLLSENELCFSPCYFKGIHSLIEGLYCYYVKARPYGEPKELSAYRYDVLIKNNRVRSKIQGLRQVDHIEDTSLLQMELLTGHDNILIKKICYANLYNDAMKLPEVLRSKLSDFNYMYKGASANPDEVMSWTCHPSKRIMTLLNSEDPFSFSVLICNKDTIDSVLFELMNQELEVTGGYSILAKSSKPTDENTLYKFIMLKIPSYMLPKRIIIVPDIKINTNGKHDINSLPNPFVESDYFADSLPSEVLPVETIVTQLLDGRKIVFDEESNLIKIGFDSLSFLRLIEKVEENYGVVLSLFECLQHPTVGNIKSLISSSDNDIINFDGHDPDGGCLPLLPSQIEKHEEHKNHRLRHVNNLVYRIDIRDQTNLQHIRTCLDQLFIHYSVLRMTLVKCESGLFQRINEAKSCPFQIVYSTEKTHDDLVKSHVKALQVSDIDLFSDALFKCVLVYQGKNLGSSTLLIYFHHVILDLQSFQRLVCEFIHLYNHSYSINSLLKDNYNQYVLKQHNFLCSIKYKIALKQLAEELSEKQREIVIKGSELASHHGNYYHCQIPIETMKRVAKLSKSLNVTNFTTYLTLFSILIFHKFNQAHFTVGVTSSARIDSSSSKALGLINNYIVIPCEHKGNISLIQQIASMYSQVLKAFDQIEINSYHLKNTLNKLGDYKKLFNLFFDYNFEPNVIKDYVDRDNLVLTGLEPSKTVNRILSFRIIENQSNGELRIRYRDELFHVEDIKKLADSYIMLISEIDKIERGITT